MTNRRPIAAPQITRAEAIHNAARSLVEAYRIRDSLPVEEPTRRAYTPTGPSTPDLEHMIRAQRGISEGQGRPGGAAIFWPWAAASSTHFSHGEPTEDGRRSVTT